MEAGQEAVNRPSRALHGLQLRGFRDAFAPLPRVFGAAFDGGGVGAYVFLSLTDLLGRCAPLWDRRPPLPGWSFF